MLARLREKGKCNSGSREREIYKAAWGTAQREFYRLGQSSGLAKRGALPKKGQRLSIFSCATLTALYVPAERHSG
jgi:hypothetical protein